LELYRFKVAAFLRHSVERRQTWQQAGASATSHCRQTHIQQPVKTVALL